MRERREGLVKSILLVAMTLLTSPVLADCVSCGPGGDCYTVSAGFSGNCECKIRSLNGVAVCKPSGVCDPSDANSCDDEGGGFPIQISTRFVNDLAKVNPLLAGAAWAGVVEANTSREGRAEVSGTMGQDGRSYTYHAEIRWLPKGAVSLVIQVQEDGAERVQRYEGTLADAGRSGRLVEVGPKGRLPVYSWPAPDSNPP
jgi:hypothetical protein